MFLNVTDAVLMRSSNVAVCGRGCIDDLVYKAIFSLLWAWLYTSSAGTPPCPTPAPSSVGISSDEQAYVIAGTGCVNVMMCVTLTSIQIVCVTMTYVIRATDSKRVETDMLTI